MNIILLCQLPERKIFVVEYYLNEIKVYLNLRNKNHELYNVRAI